MSNSRLINGSDLDVAGFDNKADEWATSEGIVKEVVNVTDTVITLGNVAPAIYLMAGTQLQSVTIPLVTSNVDIGRTIDFIAYSTFGFTIIGDDGVTVLSGTDVLPCEDQYRKVTILKLATDTWIAL